MQGVLHSWNFFHPHLRNVRLSGALPCIHICIADVKVQMQMRMQGEWPCPQHSLSCPHHTNFPFGPSHEIAGIILRNRWWPTTFLTLTSGMLTDDVGTDRCDRPLIGPRWPQTIGWWWEIPESQGRGWRFDSRQWNLLSTWHKHCRWSIASCALALTCRPSVWKKNWKWKTTLSSHT